MSFAIFFAVLSFLLLLTFLFLFDLLLFWKRGETRFYKEKENPSFLSFLERKHRRTKNPIKKNFLLYWVISSHLAQKEKEKAKQLLPFLREDSFFEIKKRNLIP